MAGNGDGAAPATPARLGGRGWWGTLRRTVKEFRANGLTDWAAALTYYAVLALFPALIFLVSILGLVGKSATQPLINNLTAVAPSSAQQIVHGALKNVQNGRGAAGVAFVIGLVLALWSASGYIGAFIRASNAIYQTPEGRPFWKLRPMQMGITFILVMLLVISALAVVISGPILTSVGNVLGLGDTGRTIFAIAKWPLLAVVVSLMFSILYYAAPNVKQPGFKWITPGGLLALVVLVAASIAFALYTKHFPNNKTYGTFGGVIFFLTWLWLANIAVLLGQELNAELERGRELAAGLPAEEEIQLPPRATPKEA
ncbi:MAG: YihY/virulence factor BrkB family protein [Thermoleophilaceae bacterium]